MTNYKSNKIKNAIWHVFYFLLFVAACALVYGVVLDSMPPVPLTVKVGDEVYKGSDNTLILPHTGQVCFDIGGADSYSVEVLPILKNDFAYQIDGVNYKFSGDIYTNSFIKEIYEDYFIIDCAVGRYSMDRLLLNLQGGNEIVLPELSANFYFSLIVTANNESVIIYLVQTLVILTGDNIIF